MLLFVSREANFQSRTMLIPMEEFLKVRQEEYNLLKNYSKSELFQLNDGSEYKVDNVLYIHYKKESKNCYSQIITPYLKFVNELTSYANGMDHYDFETNTVENCYFEMKDQIWYDLAKTNLCDGCNHVLNHKRLLEEYPNIVESFLVLKN